MWQVKFNEIDRDKNLEPGSNCPCSQLRYDGYLRRYVHFCAANKFLECVGLGNEGCIAEKIPPQKEETCK